MDVSANPHPRKSYWLSLAALAVVLPVAIVVHSQGELIQWLRAAFRSPTTVENGASQSYAGADWRLTGLARLPGALPGTTVVLAEYEAAVEDEARLRDSFPCKLALVDDRGRRWKGTFMVDPVVRKTRPDAAQKPHCGTAEASRKGDTIRMAESFVIPQDADGLMLSLALYGGMPDSLLLK